MKRQKFRILLFLTVYILLAFRRTFRSAETLRVRETYEGPNRNDADRIIESGYPEREIRRAGRRLRLVRRFSRNSLSLYIVIDISRLHPLQ